LRLEVGDEGLRNKRVGGARKKWKLRQFWWKMVAVELEFRFAAGNFRDGKKQMEGGAWQFV
jgi:hypothetical protein